MSALTIGKLAKAADVKVPTIREVVPDDGPDYDLCHA